MSECRCIPAGIPDHATNSCAKCGKALATDPVQAERDRVKAEQAMRQRHQLDGRIKRAAA